MDFSYWTTSYPENIQYMTAQMAWHCKSYASSIVIKNTVIVNNNAEKNKLTGKLAASG